MVETTLELYRSKNPLRKQRHRWRLRHSNRKVLCKSSEGYANEAVAEEIGRRVCSGGYSFDVVRLSV